MQKQTRRLYTSRISNKLVIPLERTNPRIGNEYFSGALICYDLVIH